MRVGKVYRNKVLAGILTEVGPKEYIFRYEDAYFTDPRLPAISLTLPKRQQEYKSDHLFSFFFNMLSEGVNRDLQSRQLQIDENDYFGLLLATAQYDTIGAVTIHPAESHQA
ncbi:MAG: HipA N-terminal domain-containing protein [Adhaeribacter sp.]